MTISTMTESASTGSEPRNAAIIPFPVRQAAKTALSPDQDRLATALNALNAALADQRTALAAWRGVLGELKTTTNGLDESLQRYRSSLRDLGTSVSSLKNKATMLEKWADNALTGKD